MTWKDILAAVWSKITGGQDASRSKYLNKQTEIVIQGVWDLYEEKKKLAESYLEQLKIIDQYKSKHPDNGEELDKWRQREYLLMMQLVKAKEDINYWRERAIFLEHENDLLLMKEENRNKK
jgi:hypothetical protein